MNEERIDGPTPNGGAYAIIYYQDAQGELTDKSSAVRAELIEFDANGEQVWRSYVEIQPEP